MARQPLRVQVHASVSDQLRSAEPRDFGEQVYRQLKNAPWVMASLGVHGAAFLVFAMLPTPVRMIAAAPIIQMSETEPAPELVEDPPPDIREDKPLDEPVRPEEDPVIKDTEVAEHDETDNDQPTEESLGDPRFNTDSPFEGQSTNGTIGIGGNAGGPWGGRDGGHRNLKAGGSGGAKTQVAVDLALQWLKNHQSPGGNWDADGFDAQCRTNRCSGPGESVYDPGLSGLALLCFLGAGHTHQSGDFKETVKDGLKYLRNIQDSEGCFGPRTSQHFQYNHLCASLAMTEAYGMTQASQLRDSAQRGVNFIHQTQNPYLAWRYGIRDGDNDTSVTGWAVMGLKSAIMADLDVDRGAFRGALTWIDKMTEPEFGKVGYQQRGGPTARTTAMQAKFPASESEAMTAAGVLTRIFSHAADDPDALRKDEYITKGCDLMAKKLPKWDIDAGTIDFYYWYYASLAMYQVGGEYWKQWRPAMETAIVGHQRTETDRDERGSWDPEDPWAAEGGRIYSTALNCLCMEVYYRYETVMGTK